MRPEKIREVIGIYRKEFERRGIGKIDHSHDAFLNIPEQALEHCHGMLDKMEEFLDTGRMDQAYRWLGFIQGVLWDRRFYTLEQLASHNRKDPEPG